MKTKHIALFRIPPFKPPYRRHRRYKTWLNLSIVTLHAIIEVDLDNRKIDLTAYT